MANIRKTAGIGLLSLLATACGPAPTPAIDVTTAEHVTPVRIAAVELSTATRELRLPGVVRAAQRVEPAFLVSGHLAARFVERGERVTTGQPLAGLQNPALEPSFVAAEARVRELDERLRQLGADYERARELHAQGLASAEMLDRTLAERNATREARAQAVAAVAEARDQLADAVLRAPFDGTVSDLLVEPGDFVPAGRPVLVLAGGDGLEVEVHLPEGLARRLAPGAVVEVRSVQSGERIAGRIREVGLARDGRPAPAIIALSESDAWEPGISVHVALTHAEEPALTVPVSAIVDPGTGQTRLFRIEGGRAMAVPVTVGRLVGARVTVQGELAAGDRVVVAGHQQLLDSEAVRVLP
jgi:RND family efflux transporter MFP subunit